MITLVNIEGQMQKNNELTKTLQWDGSVTIIVNLDKILIGLDFPYKQKYTIKKK